MSHSIPPEAAGAGASKAASYYQRHIFFCLNERPNGEACCAQYPAMAAFEHCKSQVKAAAVAVVYPEAVWYSYVDNTDIDEIVESHLKNGVVVDRLLVPQDVGR